MMLQALQFTKIFSISNTTNFLLIKFLFHFLVVKKFFAVDILNLGGKILNSGD